MTEREAIANIEYARKWLGRESDFSDEALDMAIAALEQQEAIKSCTPPSDDWEHYADRLYDIAYKSGYEQGKKDAEQNRWIPFKCRKATEDDGTSFDYIMDCKLPEDGQTVLVTVQTEGHEPVQVDTYYGGGGEECALDSGYSLCDEVIAWRLLPEPYQEDEA